MAYDVPGAADQLEAGLVDAWNQRIRDTFERLPERKTRFFTLDPDELSDRAVTNAVQWPGDPLEPTFCTDANTIRTLCDWGARGRHVLQNEYCEYAVVHGQDATGRLRPKRIQVTTELREYWLTIAALDPDGVRAMATQVLGDEPSFAELYGVANPHALNETQREIRFARTSAGNGGDPLLVDAKVPAHPVGRLNTERALFMTHPINGLDDLIFIVLFGAKRYAVRTPDGEFRRAAKEDIFFRPMQRALACRHADPAACLGAYNVVLDGRMLAFANPLGMYLRPFNTQLLQFEGQDLPERWIRWSRGTEGAFQRLELGPADDDDAFLDDIQLFVGQEPEPLHGGYQLVKEIEVGPLIATGTTTEATEHEFAVLADQGPIDCRSAGVCDSVATLKAEHAKATQPNPEPRVMPAP
jgi:hypothetical protein